MMNAIMDAVKVSMASVLNLLASITNFLIANKFLVTIALIVIMITILVMMSIRQYRTTFTFWSSRGIPGPTPLPFFGNTFSWMIGDVEEADMKATKKYGKVYGVYNGSEPILMVSDPYLIEDIWTRKPKEFHERMNFVPPNKHVSGGIIFSHGQEWEDKRKFYGAFLAIGAIKKINMEGMASGLIKYLEGNSGNVFNMFDTFGLHYIDIVVAHFYGMKMDSFETPDQQLLGAARDTLAFANVYSFFVGHNLPRMAKVAAYVFGKADGYLESFITFAMKMRNQSVSSGGQRDDFLQLLMKTNLLPGDHKIGLAMEVIGAGFLPIVSSVTLFMYELSRAPEVLAKVVAEVDTLRARIKNERGPDAEDPSFEDVRDHLNYMDDCYRESLRVHPSAARNWRRSSTDVNLYVPSLDREVDLPPGVGVNVPVSCLHFDPEVFHDPMTFDPDRWTEDPSLSKWHQSFGSGQRKCVGETFAYLMVKITVYHVLSRFDIEPADGTDIRRRPSMLVPTSSNVFLRVTERRG